MSLIHFMLMFLVVYAIFFVAAGSLAILIMVLIEIRNEFKHRNNKK